MGKYCKHSCYWKKGPFMISENVEDWRDNTYRIGKLDFVDLKGRRHGWNFNKNEYFYWVNLGRLKIRWQRRGV